MHVRQFQWTDLYAVVQTQNAAALSSAGEKQATAESLVAYWKRAGGSPKRDLWVVEGDSGRVEAYGGLRPWPSAGWLQVELVVRPEQHGRGLGDLLLERLAQAAAERGARYLGAIAPDEPAEGGRFLARHGFTVFVPRQHMRLQPIVVPEAGSLPGFGIRRVGAEESAALAELTNLSYAGERADPVSVDEYRSDLVESGAWVWMAEDLRDGLPVGLVEVVERAVTLNGRSVASGHIGSLAVRPGYRGRGLGRRLLAAGVRACLDAGWPTVELNVDRDNAPALALYESVGFRRVYGYSIYRRALAQSEGPAR